MAKDREHANVKQSPEPNDSASTNLGSIDFASFIASLSAAASLYLGEANPETGRTELNLAFAQEHIDILEMLKLKTANNLTSNEAALLDGLLADLQMKFVSISSGS